MEGGVIVRALPNTSDEVRDVIGGRIGQQIEYDRAVGCFQYGLLVLELGGRDRGRKEGLCLDQSEQHQRKEHGRNYRAGAQ